MSLVVTFTDFGRGALYRGQMEAAIYRYAPAVRVIELSSDAPRFDPYLASFLLAASINNFPHQAVFLAVVDPEVGSPVRKPVVIDAEGALFVGPDVGLPDVYLNQRQLRASVREIEFRPEQLSSSFHGRDLFAPVAARLASSGRCPDGWLGSSRRYQPKHSECDVAKVIYIDDFGNVMTGLRAAQIPETARLTINDVTLVNARTFCEVEPEEGFWYENSMGLVEVAINRGSAAQAYNVSLGDSIAIS